MRKPAMLKKPVEPKEPESTYQYMEEEILVGSDWGGVIFTAQELIDRITEFAAANETDLADIEIFNGIEAYSDWGDEYGITGEVVARVEKTYEWPDDHYEKEMEKFRVKLAKYEIKLAEYEAAKPEHDAKMEAYAEFKFAQQKKREIKQMREIQKKYGVQE
tara:strand:+ start:1883 stop:2365 length:483 start_codon:yes stop_codon:yes gene_type:complete